MPQAMLPLSKGIAAVSLFNLKDKILATNWSLLEVFLYKWICLFYLPNFLILWIDIFAGPSFGICPKTHGFLFYQAGAQLVRWLDAWEQEKETGRCWERGGSWFQVSLWVAVYQFLLWTFRENSRRHIPCTRQTC